MNEMIENEMDEKQEIKHWVRKKDTLSYEESASVWGDL